MSMHSSANVHPRIPFQIYALWFMQSLSVLGSSLMFFAMNLWITEVLYPKAEQAGPLATAISLASLVFIAPNILLGPLAGILTDRFNRGTLMMVCDLSNAVLAGTIAAGMFWGFLTFPLYLLLGLLMGTAGAIHSLAYFTVPPLLADQKVLPRISGLFRTTWSAANVIAPILGVVMLSAKDPQAHPSALGSVILLDALTFLLAAVSMLWLRIPNHPSSDNKQNSVLKTLKPAWDFVASHPALLQLFMVVSVVGLFYAPVVVTYPLIARHQIEGFAYPFAYATVNVMLALGGIAGGLLTFLFARDRFAIQGFVLLPMGVLGLGLIMVGASQQLWMVAAGVFLSALMVPIYSSHYYFLWQKQVPIEWQGRVFGLLRMVGQTVQPLGIGLATLVVQGLPVGMLLIGSGMLVVLLVGVFWPFSRQMAFFTDN